MNEFKIALAIIWLVVATSFIVLSSFATLVMSEDSSAYSMSPMTPIKESFENNPDKFIQISVIVLVSLSIGTNIILKIKKNKHLEREDGTKTR